MTIQNLETLEGNKAHETVNVVFDDTSGKTISPLLFGDNLEHTRGSVIGGISAEMLRNRKFVGKPGRYGCAHEWYVVGDKPALAFGHPYTRHGEGYRMHRSHECNAQYITNYSIGITGIGQKDLYILADTDKRIPKKSLLILAKDLGKETVQRRLSDNYTP